MAAVSYYLFPDGRESSVIVGEANRAISAWNAPVLRRYQAPFQRVSQIPPVTGWVSAASQLGVPPLEMLSILSGIDWAYPAHVVYREEDENRWSQAMLGLSLKPELGED